MRGSLDRGGFIAAPVNITQETQLLVSIGPLLGSVIYRAKPYARGPAGYRGITDGREFGRWAPRCALGIGCRLSAFRWFLLIVSFLSVRCWFWRVAREGWVDLLRPARLCFQKNAIIIVRWPFSHSVGFRELPPASGLHRTRANHRADGRLHGRQVGLARILRRILVRAIDVCLSGAGV